MEKTDRWIEIILHDKNSFACPPAAPGLYAIFTRATWKAPQRLEYIGYSINLKKRLQNHKAIKWLYKEYQDNHRKHAEISSMQIKVRVSNRALTRPKAEVLETKLIKRLQPRLNTQNTSKI